jgi:cell wall-associated NlpC family hydrolase
MQRTKMSMIIVAGAAVVVSTVAATAAQASPVVTHTGTTVTDTSKTFNQKAAAYAVTLEGIPYVYGGTTKKGFDCSGLTQFVYHHDGKQIVRTADEQFHQFHREAHAQARPGDLVFFHNTSNLKSYVYHVGVFEGGHEMVAATHAGSDVQEQSYLWGGNTVSFGTVSH